MPLTRLDAVPQPFVRGRPPIKKEDLPVFILDEFARLEKTVRHLTNICPQVAISEPENPLLGMIRWNKAPWDPLGTGDDLVVWNGTEWVSVASAAGLALDADLKMLVVGLTTEQKLTNLILQSSLNTNLDIEDVQQEIEVVL